MFSIIVATAVAFSAESVDGLFGRGKGSCANGTCSAAPVAVAEPKAEAKKEAAASTCAQAGDCGSKQRHQLLGRLRGCRGCR